jgi:Ca2+-binding EF-hand superfamily protein
MRHVLSVQEIADLVSRFVGGFRSRCIARDDLVDVLRAFGLSEEETAAVLEDVFKRGLLAPSESGEHLVSCARGASSST